MPKGAWEPAPPWAALRRVVLIWGPAFCQGHVFGTL